MRIAIAKIFQETDTFNPVLFGLDDFNRFGIHYGRQILDKFKSEGEIGGFIQAAENQAEEVELLPIIAATSWAGGRWSDEAMSFFKDKLATGLAEVGAVDGVLVSLHGAMASETVDDAAGCLLEVVRNQVGDSVPLVATLDHHANVTSRMIHKTQALVGYRECPHTDTLETGVRAGSLLFRILKGEVIPITAWRKVPMLTPADRFLTSEPPLKNWFDKAGEMELRQGVLSISLFPVQPWFDVHELGWSVVVITDGDVRLADELANELARMAWETRDLFSGAELLSVSEGVRRAIAADEGPVILADSGDNMNSGAPGDSTCLLAELLKQQVDCPTLLPIVDPQAVEKCIEAGVGRTLEVSVGGKQDEIYSQPVEITGRILAIGDGKVKSSGHIPVEFNMGRTVLVAVGSIKIVLSQFPGPSHEPGVYRHLGENPADAKIVVVKTPIGFRVAYKDIMKEALVVDCPGLSTPHITSLEYVRIPRPMYPFDEAMKWKPENTVES